MRPKKRAPFLQMFQSVFSQSFLKKIFHEDFVTDKIFEQRPIPETNLLWSTFPQKVLSKTFSKIVVKTFHRGLVSVLQSETARHNTYPQTKQISPRSAKFRLLRFREIKTTQSRRTYGNHSDVDRPNNLSAYGELKKTIYVCANAASYSGVSKNQVFNMKT